ncbi:MAG: imidazolonepropionase [Vicingaceae bacterium]
MRHLFTNIKTLFGIDQGNKKALRGEEMSRLDRLDNAWLMTEDGKIKDFGDMSEVPEVSIVTDLSDRFVLPSFCDSHSHLVYAAPRDGEFVDRIKGLSYKEIALRGGGILNSANKLRGMSEDDLFERSKFRLKQVIEMGTGAMEIKSGYGLDLKSELKMLRVIRRLRELEWIPIKSTFLAAHAVPAEYTGRKSEYIDMVVNHLLPEVAREGLADFVDVFCEKGYFDLDDTRRIVDKGSDFGLKAKIHVNQFNIIGGVPLAVEKNALSVDHLEIADEKDIAALSNGDCIATLLPSCSFFLSIPYSPARKLLQANIPLALASDFNPGSTPSGNMAFVASLACIKLGMLPEEAFNAATINGAFAMELAKEVGSIKKGKKANFIVTKKLPSLAYLPYSFGENHIEKIVINGKLN